MVVLQTLVSLTQGVTPELIMEMLLSLSAAGLTHSFEQPSQEEAEGTPDAPVSFH